MHGEHVHGIVVGQGGFLLHAVPQNGVVNNVVAAHKTRQVERFGGGVYGNGAAAGVLADALRGDMPVPAEDDVRPDLVGHDHYIVLFVQLHGALQLPALPHAAAGVVGRAEHGGVDPVVHDLFFHVLKIHAPDIVFVFYQRAVDDVVAVVLQAVGKTDVGGGVQQDIVSAGAENVQRADNAAQHAVFIADALLCQAGDAVARFVPADDGSKIFLRGRKIAVGRMPGAGDDGLGNGGHSGEVHIRHPHGNGVEALLRSAGCEAGRAQCIHGDGVFAAAVHDTGKIVFHMLLLLSPAGTGVENTAVKQLKC